MKLNLPENLILRLRRELKRAGRNEMGGVLVAEHVAGDTFRAVDMSFQRRGGGVAHFERDLKGAKAFVAAFHEKTGRDYQRFNYIGEWHSHPSFEAVPSITDLQTAQDIVEDADVGVNFIVLLICRLRFWGRLEISCTAFVPGQSPSPVNLAIEAGRLPMMQRVLKYGAKIYAKRPIYVPRATA